jgi:hypothetical protein
MFAQISDKVEFKEKVGYLKTILNLYISKKATIGSREVDKLTIKM